VQRDGERQHRDADEGGQNWCQGRPGGSPLVGSTALEGSTREASDRGDDDEQRWAKQVELLLNAQRPVVLEWGGRRIRGQIVRAPQREAVIARINRTGQPIAQDTARLQRRQPPSRGDRHSHQHGNPGREEPSGPGAVELGQPNRAGGDDLPPEQASDQETRHHEEDVDADETTGQARKCSVVQDNDQHGDCPQALDVRPELTAGLPIHRRRLRPQDATAPPTRRSLGPESEVPPMKPANSGCVAGRDGD
jgi:hypothetical protein